MENNRAGTSGDECRELLRAMDDELASKRIRWRSLDPTRDLARPLVELTPEASLSVEIRAAVAHALVEIADSLARNFPHNVFADLDYLAARLEATGVNGGIESLAQVHGSLVRLHDLFGRETAIHFRYVHDFLYGFDWARWTQRDPGARAGIGPWDASFLLAMEQRGGELLRTIASRNSERYAPLRAGKDRNAFEFDRSPESEFRLLRELARRSWVPIEAWRRDAIPEWNRPFYETRSELAQALHLAHGCPVDQSGDK